MKITKGQWMKVATDAGLADGKTQELWNALEQSTQANVAATFQLAHVAYYLGALAELEA